MSRKEKVKRSLGLRLLAAVGWIALKILKVAWKVGSLTGSRLAKRKVAEIDERVSNRRASSQVVRGDHA